MNTNKTIISVIIFLILVAAGFGIYLLGKKNSQPSQPIPLSNTFKPLPKPSISSANTITLSTGSGNVIVNNFLKTAVKIQDSSVYIKDNQDYTIIYFSDGNSFLIDLYAGNPNQAQSFRTEAESSLLGILGISKDDSCKLAVQMRVPASYDQDLSDADYHLSFCQNGLPIPGVQTQQAQPQTNRSIR